MNLNEELIEKLTNKKEEFKNLLDMLSVKIAEGTGNGKKLKELSKKIANNISRIDKSINNAQIANFYYKADNSIDNKNALSAANKELEDLCKEFNISTRKNKKHSIKRVIIGSVTAAALLAGVALVSFGLGKKNNNSKPDITPTAVVTLAPTATPVPTVVPTATPAPTPAVPVNGCPAFNDANDDQQILDRAKWYYDTYVSNNQNAQSVTLEEIVNYIRLCSGNKILDENGVEIDYNSVQTINAYNVIAQLENVSTSHVDIAPLFLDGTKAQDMAMQCDTIMNKISNAINNNDDVAFIDGSKELGNFFIYTCIYLDSNPNYKNIKDVEDPCKGYLLSAELADTGRIREKMYSIGNFACQDFCTNYQTNDVQQVSLLDIIDMINIDIDMNPNNGIYSLTEDLTAMTMTYHK